MRTITVRKLSENLFNELKDLPVQVTRYGRPYCVINKGDAIEIYMQPNKSPEVIVTTPKEVRKHEKEFMGKSMTPPEFSNEPKEGFHYVSYLGKYVKD